MIPQLPCFDADKRLSLCLTMQLGRDGSVRMLCPAVLQSVPQPPSDIDSAPVSSVRQKSPPGYKVFASPATKHLAKENNINLAEVTGTGPEGRITRGKPCQAVAPAMLNSSHDTRPDLS